MKSFLLTKEPISKTIPKSEEAGKARALLAVHLRQSTSILLALVAPAIVYCQQAGADGSAAINTPSSTASMTPQLEALARARAAVDENPEDGKAHYELGELLRKCGRDREAAEEYLIATSLQRDLYFAYHQLSVVCDDDAKLGEAIERLNYDLKERPADFMLRAALSELCEKRHDYYAAAKALIDIQYAGGIPAKYTQRVNARIHYLLTKDKEAQQKEADQPVATDEETGVVPAPLPETTLPRGLTAAKMKDSKELKGMGNVPLLP